MTFIDMLTLHETSISRRLRTPEQAHGCIKLIKNLNVLSAYMMKKAHPYNEGKPVAFVFKESGEHHKTSYVVWNKDGETINVRTIEKLKRAIMGIRDQIVFMTKEEIDKIVPVFHKHSSRPFAEEEKHSLLD